MTSPRTSAGGLPPAFSHGLAAATLALLLGLQPVSTDLYLPALPLLSRDLGAPMGAAQMTMAALILAFGAALLVWGPVSDRFGRRPVLLAGLALYAAAGAASAVAPDLGVLIAARVVQGIALAASVVCARAMLRDLYEPQEGARVMAIALSGLGVIALLSPTLGGLAAAWFGWRAALALVAASGLAALAFVAARVPETLAQRNAGATRWRPMLGEWRSIAVHPAFRAWALLSACTYAGLYVILAATPFVYARVLDLSATVVGFALASNSLCYIAGTFACRRMVVHHGLAGTVRRGAVLSLFGGGAGVAVALLADPSAWMLLVPQWFYMAAHGIHQPVAQAAVAGPFPRQAGSASALAGLVQAVAAFATGTWLGGALGGTVWPLVGGMGFWAVCTGFVALRLVPRATR